MKPNSILAALLGASGALAKTSLMVPLYVYPTNGGQPAWTSVFGAIEANPDLTFQIVINSGPNGARWADLSDPLSNCHADQEPDHGCNIDWRPAVTQLNTYPNVQTLGYVRTNYGDEPYDLMAANITAWNQWNSPPAGQTTWPDVSIHGIFFDETPNLDKAHPSNLSDVEFMKNITDLARQTFAGVSNFSIVYNVGTAPIHLEYFEPEQADTVIVYEGCRNAHELAPGGPENQCPGYAGQATLDSNVPAGQQGKSSVLVHHWADSGECGDVLQALIDNVVANGIQSAFFLQHGYERVHDSEAPADIATVAELFTEANAAHPSRCSARRRDPEALGARSRWADICLGLKVSG